MSPFSWIIRIDLAEICVGPPGMLFIGNHFSFWKIYIFTENAPYGFGIYRH